MRTSSSAGGDRGLNVQEGGMIKIRYTVAAERFFKDHEQDRQGFESEISRLLQGGLPEGEVKRIPGRRNDYYRIQFGGYKVVYAIIRGQIVVITVIDR